jgi:hypothetical protein
VNRGCRTGLVEFGYRLSLETSVDIVDCALFTKDEVVGF